MADAWGAERKRVGNKVGRSAGARLAGPCGCRGKRACISFSPTHEALCQRGWHALHDLEMTGVGFRFRKLAGEGVPKSKPFPLRLQHFLG